MSYVLTFLGFAALIVLHEAGHFAAAKAVGMRVERFSLFFGKLLVSVRRGETEYGIGWLPAGGYVKITGMNPHEELTPELRARAYFNQKPWKRIVVTLAGPAVNLVIAFVILLGIFLTRPAVVTYGGEPVYRSATVNLLTAEPARRYLKPGDRIVAVDGHPIQIVNQIAPLLDRHRCAGTPVAGCRAATPLRITVRRAGRPLTFTMRPRYNAQLKRMLLGIGLQVGDPLTASLSAPSAAGHSVSAMWSVASTTVSKIAKLFEASDRRQIHGIVGGFAVTEQRFDYDATEALFTLALISLSLAVVNLFPFLPLDGGHVFWAVAEKLRGRAISFQTMERAGVVGFVLIIMLFAIGLSNDISTLSGSGFNVR